MGDHSIVSGHPTASYSVHALTAAVSGWPDLLDAVHQRLESFAAAPAAAPDLTIAFEASDAAVLPDETAASRRVYEFPHGVVTYRDEEGLLTIDVGRRVRARCWPAEGRAHVTVASPRPSDLWTLSHPVLSVTLMEMLKRCDLFPIHAAGLAPDGRGLLLAGARGSGKSTLTLALTRAGAAFLSDDMVLLAAGPAGWHLRAFPDQVDLCDDTFELFPELQRERDRTTPPDWLKRQVRPETAYGVPIAWDVPAHVLVFPGIRRSDESVLTPIPAEEALLELAPNVLLTDMHASQRHFDALAGLVAQCRCYRLATGRRLDQAAARLREAVLS